MIRKLLIILFLIAPFVSAEQLSPYPDELDYRDFHGKNWMSPVKNQGQCGSCWAFATTATIESFINLYYNQHLNIDLSEQQLTSNCCENCGSCGGGFTRLALDYIQESGIVTESCFPYEAEDTECLLCINQEPFTWNIEHNNIDITNKNLAKSTLYSKGPLPMIIPYWNHAVSFVGYDTENTWTFKNSWGEDWGEDGYGRLYTWENNYYAIYFRDYITNSPDSPEQEQINIDCMDKDRDRYCYWGISESIPETCPEFCQSYKDEDDSNPEINREPDLWISDYSIHEKIKNDESNNFQIEVSFKGNEEIPTLNDIELNLYINETLFLTEQSPVLFDGQNHMFDFNIYASDIPDPLLNKEFRWEATSELEEQNRVNNNFEHNLWIYNYENGFYIGEDNYIFDCTTNNNPEGELIEYIIGPKEDSPGIRIEGDNITIKNCFVGGWDQDIYISESSNSNVHNNNLGSGSDDGIFLTNSENNEIKENIISNNYLSGIRIEQTSSNNLINSNNISTKHGSGIVVNWDCNNNTLEHNSILDSYAGIIIHGNENQILNNLLLNNQMLGIALSSLGNSNKVISNVGLDNGNLGGISLRGNNSNISKNRFCQSSYSPYYTRDLWCHNSAESNFGTDNYFGYLSRYGSIRGVDPCQDGWPEHEIDFLTCNQLEEGMEYDIY